MREEGSECVVDIIYIYLLSILRICDRNREKV